MIGIKESIDAVRRHFSPAERLNRKIRNTQCRKVTFYKLTIGKDGNLLLTRRTKLKFCEIPDDAVHVTGESNAYALVDIGPAPVIDNAQCTAVDLNAWMLNNDINDALSLKWTSKMDFDIKKIAMIVGIGIAVIVVYLMVV